MAYLYRHIRLDKNEPFYIGIGSDHTFKRAREQARRNALWKRIVAKTAYEVEILFDGLTFEEAKLKEIEFIKLYGRINLNTGTLSNMTDGGDGTLNKIFSAEYRKKLSEKAKTRTVSEDQKEKLRKYRTGKINSPEARRKISIANTGKKLKQCNIDLLKLRVGDKNPAYGKTGANSPNFKFYLLAIKDNTIVGKYEGVHDCARKLNLSATKISAVLNGRRNMTGGYKFSKIL